MKDLPENIHARVSIKNHFQHFWRKQYRLYGGISGRISKNISKEYFHMKPRRGFQIFPWRNSYGYFWKNFRRQFLKKFIKDFFLIDWRFPSEIFEEIKKKLQQFFCPISKRTHGEISGTICAKFSIKCFFEIIEIDH